MSRRLPVSPALLLAAVALFVALGGAAYAGSKIGTSQLKSGAVTSKKLAKGAVKSKNIAEDAVTGKQVDEATLGQVPAAADADRAGGLKPAKFSARLPIGSALRPVATVGTLELRFGCNGSGRPLFDVVPTAGAPPQTTRASVQLAASSRGSGQGTLPAGGITVLDGTDTDASFDGSVDSLTDGGAVTTVQWAARSTAAIPSPNPDAFNCLFWGAALSG
jgi:hypothetical protein